MRILFLAARARSIEPFGIMSLVPALRQHGHQVALLEADAPGLPQRVRTFQPDVIGYSVCTGAQRYYLELNRQLKSALEFVAVFGGPHPTFFPDMIHEAGVDAICRGEGDQAFAEFCDELAANRTLRAVPNIWVKVDDEVERSELRPLVSDLDELPWVDRELYYGLRSDIASHPVRSFLASRGCPYRCSYCFNQPMDELYDGQWRKVRVRSPASLVAEIGSVTASYPTEFVAFRESIFPMNHRWLEEFATLYARQVGLPFYCHLRLDLLTRERVRLLAEAGCHSVNVGIEAGDPSVRGELLARPMSDEQILRGCGLLREHGIKVLANNMLGLPGTTFAHDLRTLRLNQRCRPDYALAMLWQPYPGTELARFAVEQGHFHGNYDCLDFSYYYRSHLHFRGDGERRRIENLQKLFGVAAMVPATTPLVTLLSRLPPNRVFDTIFETVYLVFHQTEIFPHRVGWRDWALNLRHIAMES